MGESLSAYIRNIAFYLVFSSFVGIILPDGKYKKYISVVIGLVLIIVILGPLVSFVFGQARSVDSVLAEISSNLDRRMIDDTAKDEELRAQLISENFKSRIRAMLEPVAQDHGFELTDMELDADMETGEIFYINLWVSERPPEPTPAPFIRVEKVRIGVNESEPENIESGETNNFRISIADFYNISVDNIHIYINTDSSLKK